MKLFFRRTLIVILLLGALSGTGYVMYSSHLLFGVRGPQASVEYKTPQEAADPYVRFDMEAYDDIQQNYWQVATDTALSQFFQASLQKAASSTSQTLPTPDRAGTAEMLQKAFSAISDTAAKKALAVQIVEVALYNLAPIGRDELLSQAQQTQLQDTVQNINPGSNLYGTLGLSPGASVSAVNEAYQTKATQLAATTSASGQAQLKQVSYAHEVLSQTSSKTLYDQSQIEPTVFSHILGAHTLYLDLSKISPTTLQEFGNAISAASTTPSLTNLIIDLRGNIGGDLQFTQYFLALFLGPNQYAFDLFHQGSYDAQRTLQFSQYLPLAHFSEVALLTDNMTQSTAELIAASMKRYHLATVVGTTTRGWGSVETQIPLKTVIDPNQQYALLLVSNLTLGDTELPIEGSGVTPDIATSNPSWRSELSNYFRSSDMISALSKEAVAAPLQ